MAISGSLNYEGLEITGSYTNIKHVSYTKNDSYKVISFDYQLFVNESHRINGGTPLLSKRTQFTMTSSLDTENLLNFAYNSVKSEPYYVSSSFIDC
jgi:hypothetical protein